MKALRIIWNIIVLLGLCLVIRDLWVLVWPVKPLGFIVAVASILHLARGQVQSLIDEVSA